MSHDSRVAALDGLLEDPGLDAVLATKDASIAYLTGFWGLQLERFFGVAVKRGGERRADRAVARPRQRRHARRPASTRRSTTPRRPTGCRRCSRRSTARSASASRRTTSTSRARRRCRRPGYELVPATDLIMHLRAAKDAEEVDAGPHACAHIIEVYEELWADAQGRRQRGRRQRQGRLQPRPPRRQPPRAAHPLRRPRGRPARLARRAHAAGRAT